MEQRLNSYETAQGAIQAMLGITKYLSKSKIEPKLLHLVEFRVSQINGCAYCLDMSERASGNSLSKNVRAVISSIS